MKIAPPDGSGKPRVKPLYPSSYDHLSLPLLTDPPDTRYIRAETCMFLVKLPQYSSLELMTERLKYAINCREDPLSG